MAMEESMALVWRLLTEAQALAAVTARLRLDEMQVTGDPVQRAQLDRVVTTLAAKEHLASLTSDERAIVIAFARSYLKQALDLMEEPERPGAWNYTDPVLLQAQGNASRVVATLIREAGLGKADARCLDIGTGVAGIAMALCELFPQAQVVGIDPWEPSLALARKNVAEAGLGARITLEQKTIEQFADSEGFDLAWLPSFFLPDAVIDPALMKVHGMMRPGGRMVVGVTDGPDDSLAGVCDALMTVRSGGALLNPEQAVARLSQAGFTDAREVPRTWKAPLRLAVGIR